GFALRWSVKDSFWNYVTAAGGEIAPGDGAGIDGTAAVFPLVAGTPAHESPLRFHGSVRSTAHHGMLSITVRDPEIHWE
ncbi:HtaA domain-containing protein, partial [Streptomyces scabiei]|uniref:HtaA domain-containing protein n=1 Tax=Streptomyces scabiei TaxID=1930 RepID=UPI0038F67AE5